MRSLAQSAVTSLEKLLETIIMKIRINFSNIGDAYTFFDCSYHQSRCKKEHFVYNLAFLNIDHDFREVCELFDLLD